MGTRTETSGDETNWLDNQLQKLNFNEKRDINILLLGETGVGKSTFINAFCNYLQFPTLQQAMKMRNQFVTLIPAKFTIMDENYKMQVVKVGADENEFVETGASATQASKSYVFPIKNGKTRIRLIDTPGVGDVRGINQDNSNFDNILSFIGELKHLNAICILLKPNSTRLTVMFEFCIKQLLSRLEKSASQNIIFIFTNSRSTFYRPGETLATLTALLDSIESDITIPLSFKNMFCLDNEAFRFLVAHNNGIKFSNDDIHDFSKSWEKSCSACWKMIHYITGDTSQEGLPPHLVKNTISVNEARRLVVQLSQPLAEIADLIQDNITILERHKKSLGRSDNTLADLQKRLYVPVINLRVIPMDQPTTVCTSQKCSTLYPVGDRQKWHYHQRCHKPCYLSNVPKEIIGAPELTRCAAMDHTGKCKECSCQYQFHMHIYFETEVYEERQENEAIKSEIKDKNFALLQAKNIIQKIEKRLKEYEEEKDIILKTTAKFAHFLQKNAITAYNDAYEGYLLYLIDREKSMGVYTDYNVIKEYQTLLQQYKEEKNALNAALLHSPSGTTLVTPDDVINCVDSLYSLKHNGSKIKELFYTQKSALKNERKSDIKEYVHRQPNKQKKNKQKKNAQTKTNYPSNNNQQHYNNNTQMPPPLLPHYNSQHHQRFTQHNNPPQQNYTNQGPIQYLQVKQGPSGQLDFRFGNNPQQMPRNPQNPISNPHGAYPKNYDRNFPQNNSSSFPQNYYQPQRPNQSYQPQRPNQNYQQGRNQNYYQHGRYQNYHQQGPNQNYHQQGPNQNYYQRPNYRGNQNFERYNKNPNDKSTFHDLIDPKKEGPKHFNQNPRPDVNRNRRKSFGSTKNYKDLYSDSGCESGNKGKGMPKRYNSCINLKTHNLDESSSSSDSDSSSN